MSFRNEVRGFMRKMNDAFIEHRVLIEQQVLVIKSLAEQNKDLLNRLMARDLPEFQTYSPVVATTNYGKTPTVDLSDEDLAGTVLDVEGERVE